MIFNSNYESFKIGDTSNFSEYTKGGIVYQVKKPITKQYYPFCQRAMMFCDKYHPVSSSDGSKSGRSELLYMALSGIHDFYIKNNCTLPEVNNEKQYKEIAQNVKSMYETVKKNKNNPCLHKSKQGLCVIKCDSYSCISFSSSVSDKPLNSPPFLYKRVTRVAIAFPS